MSRYWGNFIRNGDPNDAGRAEYPEQTQKIYDQEKLPQWNSYHQNNDVMKIGTVNYMKFFSTI